MGRRTLETDQLFANRYEIVRVLGEGGMGTVYLAIDNIIREEVALKVMHADYSQEGKHVERFIREVQVSRKIAHPHVVRTYDAGLHEGQLYFTMECVLGESLKEELKRGPLEPLDVASILMQVCDGLAAIHATNVVHRDLKPANFIRAQNGEIKIADFGIARAEMSQLTGHEEVIGSTAYMAPEIWSGKDIGPPADIYALGVSAFELLVGDLPFRASTPAELMWKHLEQPPPAAKEKVPSIPGWLNDLILILLEKNPESRPCKAEEIRDFLLGHLDSDSVSENVFIEHPSPTVLSTHEREYAAPITEYDQARGPGYHTSEYRPEEMYSAEHDPYSAPGVTLTTTDGDQYELEPFVVATGEHEALATSELSEGLQAEIDELYGPRGNERPRASTFFGGVFVLALVLVLLLFPAADFLVVRWRLALAARHSGQITGYALLIFVYYSVLLSTPSFAFALLRGTKRPSRVWLRMGLVVFGLLCVLFAFFVVSLDSKLQGASKLLQVAAYSSAVEPSVVKMVQSAFLHPLSSVYQIVNQNGVVQISRQVGSVASPLDLYYVMMFIFLFSLISLVRGNVGDFVSRLKRASVVLVILTSVISFERFLAPWFSKPSVMGIVEKVSPQVGVFFPVFDWYTVGCGIFNWMLVLSYLVILPRLLVFYRRSFRPGDTKRL